jgi:hypothetical protein
MRMIFGKISKNGGEKVGANLDHNTQILILCDFVEFRHEFPIFSA